MTTWPSKDAYILPNIFLSVNSDHQIMVTEIEVWQIDSNIQMPIYKPNKRYNWNNTTTKQWLKFSEQIEQQIISNLNLK